MEELLNKLDGACTQYLNGELDDAGFRAVIDEIPAELWQDKQSAMTIVKALVENEDLYDVSLRKRILFAKFICNLLPKTVAALAEHPNIVGLKEASGNMSQAVELFARCGDKLDIYSGNDDQIVPIMSLGGKGVISVLSNIIPKETHDICYKFFEGDIEESRRLQLKYLDLISALFCEVNPIPVKNAMNLLGKCAADVRMPLCEMEPQHYERLKKAMQGVGLI